ncbi:MAG: B12-binding domain-containing radical SAM protein [Candidatus Omnitrophica bacterium]|nr:B12-binding domain-containing radical SAM protein [Candidatus Omnitrophota bacterium]
MSKYKILFLYPNGLLMNPPAISIGIFTALLKPKGFELALFDTTLYPEKGMKGSDDAKKENLQVKPFDYGTRGVKPKETMPEDDLRKKIQEFTPDLILISMLECTYQRGLELLNVVKDFDIPVMAGGVFPTFAPEKVLAHEAVDFVCVGEGEETVVEFCENMAAGKDCSQIKNLCFKKDGQIICNPVRPLVDINSLPVPDYSLFEPERFFRPMAGTVYQTIPVETNRGCPFQCAFCNSPSMAKLYKSHGQTFFRIKNIETIKREIRELVKAWKAEYIYFSSDNFLVGPQAEFDEFIDFYKEIKLPFWMQTRPETVTKERIQKLKDVGCHRMSMGLEHGNAEFRTKVLKKTFDNATMIKASQIIAEVGVPLTVNNIIGFPGETRDLVFDTIELNRQITADSVNCAVFAPFHGSPLHKVCLEKGYIADDLILGSLNTAVPMDMPKPFLTRQDIQGIRRVFVLYVKLPREYWPKIKRAETFDEEGNRIFNELRQICLEKYN